MKFKKSIHQVVKEIKKPYDTVYKWMTGKHVPLWDNLVILGHALDIPPLELMRVLKENKERIDEATKAKEKREAKKALETNDTTAPI